MLSTIAAVVIATLALLGTIGAIVRWLYKRGGDERTLSNSIDQHAKATTALATQVEGLKVVLEDHSYKLLDHDYRLRALEKPAK